MSVKVRRLVVGTYRDGAIMLLIASPVAFGGCLLALYLALYVRFGNLDELYMAAVIAGGAAIGTAVAGVHFWRRSTRPMACKTYLELQRFSDPEAAVADLEEDGLRHGEPAYGFVFAERWMLIHGSSVRALRYEEITRVRVTLLISGEEEPLMGDWTPLFDVLMGDIPLGERNAPMTVRLHVWWADGFVEGRHLRHDGLLEVLSRMRNKTANNEPPVEWEMPDRLWELVQDETDPEPATD